MSANNIQIVPAFYLSFDEVFFSQAFSIEMEYDRNLRKDFFCSSQLRNDDFHLVEERKEWPIHLIDTIIIIIDINIIILGQNHWWFDGWHHLIDVHKSDEKYTSFWFD